jgi:hypothetical protein
MTSHQEDRLALEWEAKKRKYKRSSLYHVTQNPTWICFTPEFDIVVVILHKVTEWMDGWMPAQS